MEKKENSYVLLLEIKIPEQNYKGMCVGITFSKMCMHIKIYILLHELKKDPLDKCVLQINIFFLFSFGTIPSIYSFNLYYF